MRKKKHKCAVTIYMRLKCSSFINNNKLDLTHSCS